MNDTTPLASFDSDAPVYQDRSNGLMVFGVLTMLLGCLSGLLVLLMFVGQAFAAKTTHVPPNFAAMTPAALVYGVLSVALIWLGIGSLLARRWARALLLIFSWSWLVMGIIVIIGTLIVLPVVMANLPSGKLGQPAPPPGMMWAVMGFTLMFGGFFMVVLPGIWIYFYGSPSVKANCEKRYPTPSWTDASPLPVIALSLWLLFAVPFLLLMPVTHNSVMPFFGILLSGLPGMILCWLTAGLWCYAAWLIYRLNSRGWWLILIAMVLFLVSSMLTFARHDIWEMYRLMDYPQADIDQIKKLGLFAGNRIIWVTPLFFLPFLGYLLFVKKYFRTGNY